MQENNTITISTEEYRALVEASVAVKYAAKIESLERELEETREQSTDRAVRLYDQQKQIESKQKLNESLEAKIKELQVAGERMIAYIDSDEMIRADFNRFDATREEVRHEQAD
jgi:uncharacterized protein YydD (DUF2326 family)